MAADNREAERAEPHETIWRIANDLRGSVDNVRKRARKDPNLNETLARVLKDIEACAIGADSEDDFKGLFDDLDVNMPHANRVPCPTENRVGARCDFLHPKWGTESRYMGHLWVHRNKVSHGGQWTRVGRKV